jgi:alanine dehydrogenase
MMVGIPREIKSDENRVALLPVGAEMLVQAGHQVLLEEGAGRASGCLDEEYAGAGAEIVDGPEPVYERSDLIVKVKEPLGDEYPLMRQGQVLFCYFHFAADQELTRAVQEAGVTAIAYETVQMADGSLPLLIPMSEVAGRMALQEGAKYLESPRGYRGFRPRTWPSSAGASWDPTPRGSRRDWARRSSSWISTFHGCATSTM